MPEAPVVTENVLISTSEIRVGQMRSQFVLIDPTDGFRPVVMWCHAQVMFIMFEFELGVLCLFSFVCVRVPVFFILSEV